METTTLNGVGLTDTVKQYRGWSVEGGPRKEQTRQRPLTEVLSENDMQKLSELAGDGGGKVTVGATLAHSKEFGNKAEAFVSFSVTTDNDLPTMMEVHDFLQPHVRNLVNADLREMMVDRDAYLDGQVPDQVKVPPGKARVPPPGAGKPKPVSGKSQPRIATPPRAGVSKATPGKPNLRR
jgi:hypothetical protein